MAKVYKLRIGIIYEDRDHDGVIARCTNCSGTIHVSKTKHIIIDGSPYCLRCGINKLKRMLPK